jgi:ribonucleoside-diphosphate reductase alpha chain
LNLTEVVIREHDTEETLLDKIETATIMGTYQASLTNFPYLRSIWHKNTSEESLLGVSLTGIMDNPLTARPTPELLTKLRLKSVEVNLKWSALFGIPQSTAITAVKPSGTVSQLVDSASGIHARHSAYYIRRVRGDNKDPLTKFMIESGVPNEPDITKPGSTTVFSFPMKAPKHGVLREGMTALEQLEAWLLYARHYCEHKPSVTISVTEEEWPEVGAWMWKYFDEVSGVSFLPYDGGSYKQAPYEECSAEEYAKALAAMPKDLDWDALNESEDNVEGAQMLACSAGVCEI